MMRSSGPAHGEDDAELRRAQGGGLGRGRQDLVGVEEGRGLHGRVEARRLRAEVAVLGTPPRLGRQDALHLDGGPAPRQAHLVRQRRQAHHRLVGHHGEAPQLVGLEETVLVEQGHRGGGEGGPGPGRVGRRGEPHRAGLDGRSQGDGATRGGGDGVGRHRHTVAAGPAGPGQEAGSGVGLRDRT